MSIYIKKIFLLSLLSLFFTACASTSGPEAIQKQIAKADKAESKAVETQTKNIPK